MGLDKFEKSDQNEMEKQFSEVIKDVDINFKEPMPIFLGATAGLRMLNMTNPKAAEELLDKAEAEIKKLKVNNIDVDLRGAKILTGNEEVLYVWITTKYLSQLSKNDTEDSPIGVLDMGGASAQIAYETDTVTGNEATLFGRKYNIFSSSNLCYGSDQALIRHRFLLMLNNKDYETKTTEPCIANDLAIEINRDDFINDPCLDGKNKEFITGLKSDKYKFTGSGNVKECERSISNLLTIGECEKNFNICFKVDKAPSINFYATKTFFYSASLLDTFKSIANDAPHTMDKIDMYYDIQKYCSKSGKELVPVETTDIARKILIDDCGKMFYIYKYLSQVHGFDEVNWKNLSFENEIEKNEIGWSMGYMLDATNTIPRVNSADTDTGGMGAFGVTMIVLLCIALVGGIGYVVYIKRDQITGGRGFRIC